MKGPGHRSKHDVRRVWECPNCHRRDLTSGNVVNRRCDCLSSADPTQETWMRLVEDKPLYRRSTLPPLSDPPELPPS